MSLEEPNSLMHKSVILLSQQIVGIGPDIDDSVIQTIKIEYQGQQTPLQHLCSFTKKDRRVSITPYDRNLVSTIEETLKKQGFDAYKFSTTSVVVNIPIASGEVTKKLEHHKQNLVEQCKVSIRNIRRKFRTKENDKELQKLTDAYIHQIEALIK